MAIPVKAMLAGAATIGAGATGIWMISTLTMPEWRPLVQDEEFLSSTNNNYKGKYGDKYARLLVGAGTAKSGEQNVISDNKAWWEWAYKNLYDKANAKGGFANLKQGSKAQDTETEDKKSLQKACDDAYKADASNGVITTDPQGTETNKFKEEEVWLFCSPGRKKPQTIEEMKSKEGEDKTNIEGSWKGKIGENNKDDLLAISANSEIWQILEYQARDSKIGPTSGFFSLDKHGKDIKGKCKTAYGLEVGTTDEKPTEEDLYKWCSMKGKKTTNT